jgi:MFS family permease
MSLSRNITVASWRAFFGMFLVIVPVLVPYWRSLGLSMHEVLEIQALFGLAMVLLEVPTGYIADLFGRKISVVLGGLISGLTFTFLPFARTYNELVIYEIALALAATLVSGAEDAIVYESIPAAVNRRKIIGSFRVWSLSGETLAALLAGVLVMYSFELVVWAQAIVGWAPFCFALLLIEPPRSAMVESTHTGRIAKVFSHVLVEDSLTRLIFINYVVWGLSSFCVVWLLQEYWTQVGVPLPYFGVIWAALMAASAIVSKYVHVIEHRIGAAGTLAVIALAPISGYLLMGYAPPVVGITAGVLFYITRGLSYVVFQDAFNWRIPSSYRATANSLLSLCFRLGFVPIGPLLGTVIDTRGMTTALGGLALAFGVCGVVLMLPLIKRLDEMHVHEIPSQ